MLHFVEQKWQGLKKRIRCSSFGIFYFTSKGIRIPAKLRVNGKAVPMHFDNAASNAFLYEFTEICINDCYKIRLLKRHLGKVSTIVDVGANQGLFLIASRKLFPRASIQAYEPNPNLQQLLTHNASVLKTDVFFEAVTDKGGRVNLQFAESDLHTRAQLAEDGGFPAVSFSDVVGRAKGEIDVLKLDCEGGEWDLFEDTESWKHVNSIVMEYHLWSRAGSTVKQVCNILEKLGFAIISLDALTDQFGLLTAIKKEKKAGD